MDSIYYELTVNVKSSISLLKLDDFERKKGILINSKGENYCYICGNENLTKYNNNIYCRNCIEFEAVYLDTYFYQKRLESNRVFDYADRLDDILFTTKQLEASKFIMSSIFNQSDCLIHAVCGAGKTEIVFQAISYILKQNKYVCFAIPRIDILYDVKKRIEYTFFKTRICILNSNEDKVQHGQLYIMTTNQILKFKQAFSLIIVDEVDAFPYEYNFKYDFGVQQAKIEGGSLVYLTSTPSKKFIDKNINTYVLNRRWHGYLLPVPEFEFFDIDDFLKNGNSNFIRMVNKYSSSNKQLLMFISNIVRGEKVVQKLFDEGIFCDFVFSNCKERKIFIEKFLENKSSILLTTTILERGVTFGNIDAIVLDSDNHLYNKASLIQIAGRVGRKKEHQTGKVYYYYKVKTEIMESAVKDIKMLNL